MIFRVFVEKKQGFDIKAKELQREIKDALKISCSLRYLVRYDYEGDKGDFDSALSVVFSEPPADTYYLEKLEYSGKMLNVELLPGQYDQRADSAAQCISMLTLKDKPNVRCAAVYIVDGVTDAEFERIKNFLINPVESREGNPKKAEFGSNTQAVQPDVRAEGFVKMDEVALKKFFDTQGFAFSFLDLKMIQDYFKSEKRDPFFAELRVLDTYWSDHCRHTTFNTELKSIDVISDIAEIKQAKQTYEKLFDKHFAAREDKYPSLMNLATIAARELKQQGLLPHLDESEEVNACSIRIVAEVDGQPVDYTVMFKNETHNHPTEIEPFGGAATCLGGAIRDPLSGRVYVYQSMRVTGAADINAPLEDTLKGKLPQRVISTKAAAGFSSYGNQIGLATGQVREYYHSGYAAKRMEVGFVVGAAPTQNIRRERPQKGDVVLLIGGATGRDGCGGATGSSKAHSEDSLTTLGAEVQKGNPITERKLQRLFRDPEFTRLVKRCNDFGAGGVSVAIGELSDSMDINLDLVPKKYASLSGLELAISESQERMAVVIASADLDAAKKLCDKENLDAECVAEITDTGRMRMFFNGQTIVDLSREFLDTNGVKQTASAVIKDSPVTAYFNSIRGAGDGIANTDDKKGDELFKDGRLAELLTRQLKSANEASQKGLGEWFDSTIGASTVLMPFGGKNQLSPSISMAAKLPTSGESSVTTVAAHGFDPHLSTISPFAGAVYAVTDSVIKAAVSGADYDTIYLTFQEYFERLRGEKERWGKPTSALLGALHAQLGLKKAAIGGKDSMSGSFESLDVPPTLISFALGTADARNIVGSAAKKPNTFVFRYKIRFSANRIPDFEHLLRFISLYQAAAKSKAIEFVTVAGGGGVAAALAKTLLGGGDSDEFDLGFDYIYSDRSLFTPAHGDVVFGIAPDMLDLAEELLPLCVPVGRVNDSGVINFGGDLVTVRELTRAFASTFDNVFPSKAGGNSDSSACLYNNESKSEKCGASCSSCSSCAPNPDENHSSQGIKASDFRGGQLISRAVHIAKPRVFIPVFPGTNCEYDTQKAFERAGAQTSLLVIKNRSAADLKESVLEVVRQLNQSNILMLPGGFSGGDEPDGSGKFIIALLQNPLIAEAVDNLLYKRDGLALGICNGFQALIKLGLLPSGHISTLKSDSPTLTFNTINRHISQLVRVRIGSNLSPWLAGVRPGEVFNQAVSHGEGRFVASPAQLAALVAGGQVVSQYCDFSGNPTMVSPFNPNGSVGAVEGICSADGRILGKMGHSERIGRDLYKNCDNLPFDIKIFESGVKYYL